MNEKNCKHLETNDVKNLDFPNPNNSNVHIKIRLKLHCKNELNMFEIK